MDSNGNGLQDSDESGFPGDVVSLAHIELYADGSNDAIEVIQINDSGNGEYSFNDVPDGDYYLCASNEFRFRGFSPVTPNSGDDDTIDSDFDSTPCSYEIYVYGGQVVKRDLGLVASVRVFVGHNIKTEITPSSSLDPNVSYASISIRSESTRSVAKRLEEKGISSTDAFLTARAYRGGQYGAGINGNGAYVNRISGGRENPEYHPDLNLNVSNVIVDTVSRGSTRLTLSNVTVTNKIFGSALDPLVMTFNNSTLCGVFFEKLVFFGVAQSSAPNPCP
jgi:hypothetical protein